jgi:hypothetical protein
MADDSLYVGYLPLPPRHARFLRVFIPVSLWTLVILNGAILLAMTDPGAASWNTDDTVTISGVIREDGIPLVVTDEGEAVLLVRDSKRGAFDGVVRGGPVAIAGFILERDGRRMLEITEAEASRVATWAPGENPIREARPVNPITLRGEILDAKCFLGAMKPGHGKTHKACATLCIRGGIPAAMRIRNPDGTEDIAVIVGPGFSPFPESLRAYIADPVEISGSMFRVGDLTMVAVDPATVRRIAR